MRTSGRGSNILSTPGWTVKIEGTESTGDEVRAEKGKSWASADGPGSSSASDSAVALGRRHQTPTHVVGRKYVSPQRQQRCGLPL